MVLFILYNMLGPLEGLLELCNLLIKRVNHLLPIIRSIIGARQICDTTALGFLCGVQQLLSFSNSILVNNINRVVRAMFTFAKLILQVLNFRVKVLVRRYGVAFRSRGCFVIGF